MSQLPRHTIETLGYEYTPMPINDPRYLRLPYCLRPLLENALRRADTDQAAAQGAESILDRELGGSVPFWPSRVLLQEGLGIPLLTDLTAFRDAAAAQGFDPNAVDTAVQTDLIIDHSLRVDSWANPTARAVNERMELRRNRERFAFVRWAQGAYKKLRVVPPGKGIMHQINLERLATVVGRSDDPTPFLSPDTLVGTDSHTPMINGIGVVGWGVGGIEAEGAMLDNPVVFALPKVTGVEIVGRLPEGATATDLVLTITETLRAQDVVGQFVEFYGPGLTGLTVADRATIANMAPEYGATMAYFPVDERTVDYLRTTGRDPAHVDHVETYMRQQGMWFTDDASVPDYNDVIRIDLAQVLPCIAGPRNPEQRIDLVSAAARFHEHWAATTGRQTPQSAIAGTSGFSVQDGAILIAAITSCTNTSNPVGMATAGLVARKARLAGLAPKPWVKTSFTPGSRIVAEQLKKTGLLDDLNALGFQVAGFGCATCNGNSGDLAPEITDAVIAGEIFGTAVLSGNRNFAGRIHPHVNASYLASPALVVAYAIAGSMFTDITTEPLDSTRDIYLRDLWPTSEEVAAVLATASDPDEFVRSYEDLFEGSEEWNALAGDPTPTFDWDQISNYIRRPPWFEDVATELPAPPQDIDGARALVVLGDSVTTDDISPSGAIHPESPAGRYLQDRGVERKDFNSYVSRRADHVVAQRATFANRRLKNAIMQGHDGPFTKVFPEGQTADVYDAAMTYRRREVPLLVFAGRNYGCGSSRDWAAKGPNLLGVKAIVAGSFERIHRANLVRMNLIPLQLPAGTDIDSLKLDGTETFDVHGISDGLAPDATATLSIHRADGTTETIDLRIRIETDKEVDCLRHGGVLPAIMREFVGVHA
ncbi:aconitate hydratase AcnA [Rhodococcus sp. T2V]|uniref:aconitate hydratase AcnA n=1 Tax=Rhodococcus sp. T2V TaxID=3034164 RepID=UPI0023E22274|nr:aconitate hydratase AcnA [Rhodococcus sp. T2V]MDF3312043.1 aconitate hydratase AcnA [Rhodococcus sp. T2V]